MGGLLVIVVLVLYIWIARKVLRRVNPIWGKALVVLAFVLIPTADAVYGRIKLAQLCEAEGGLRVYKTVQNVGGFFEELGPAETWIKEYGFAFAEGPGTEGGRSVNRLSKDSDGAAVLEKNVERKSIYQLRIVRGDLSEIYLRSGFVVETSDGKNQLGKFADIHYAGGWVERAVNGLYASRGTAGTCGLSTDSRGRMRELVVATLNPVKK